MRDQGRLPAAPKPRDLHLHGLPESQYRVHEDVLQRTPGRSVIHQMANLTRMQGQNNSDTPRIARGLMPERLKLVVQGQIKTARQLLPTTVIRA
jgi:hypothetical protein